MKNENKKEELIKAGKFTLFSASAAIIEEGTYQLLTKVTFMRSLIDKCAVQLGNAAWLNKLIGVFGGRQGEALSAESIAYFIGLVLSVVWNFTLNRKFTFKSASNVAVAMLKVFLFYLVFTPLSTLFHNYLVSRGWNDDVATVVNMLINFVTEFLYQKYFVFRDSLKKAENPDA
ncbi:MAG: GtrA family protein [Clostridia bacterium]|nr:GtrA family protein [Clostridia bacterium]